jgi:UDP-glucose 4-epimerase
MTILITGAAGFIGSHTVDRLLAEGHTVVGLDNLRTGHLENLRAALSHDRFHFEHVDVTDVRQLDPVMSRTRPDAIIHLAALVSVQESMANPALNQWLNVEATRVVAAAATAHRVPRMVFSSSAAVYGDCADLPLQESSPTHPLSPYGAAKLESENILFACARTRALSVVAFRYFNVYGLRQDAASPYSGVISIFSRRLAAGQPATVFGDGGQTRDFIHVSDVARANAQAATRPGLDLKNALNICTGRPTSLNQLVKIFRSYYPDAPETVRAAARPGDIYHSCGQPAAAQTALGFSAAVQIQDGLRDFAPTTAR